ncbi:DUF2062 domain-containing protein [Halofilum ochraceum]|uniref:DUF2062 domain-containing protein n=1 Tax=Halofilum ochraceum TaxID=1611323 RepID=UPI0008DA3EF0|nr:DUF2062 domain-containing protein [Halofilum ochraceum]
MSVSQRLIGGLRQHWCASRERTGVWLERHPVAATLLDRAGCLHPDRRTLARGVAVGVFVGLSPTVGFQTLLMLLGCVALRANFPIAFLVSWVSNPLTMAPLYLGFNRLGEAVFHGATGKPTMEGDTNGWIEIGYLAFGSLVIALPLAIISYALVLAVWRAAVVRRRRKSFRERLAVRARYGDRGG